MYIFVTVDTSELGCPDFLQWNKVPAVSLVGAKVEGEDGRIWGRK
jgi:hypothetical protein